LDDCSLDSSEFQSLIEIKKEVFSFLNNLYTDGKIDIFTESEKNQIEKSLGMLTSDLEVILTFSDSEITSFLDTIDAQISTHQEKL
jgi:RNA polymerase-interacting CarD/CdnL/TRCF family regulator